MERYYRKCSCGEIIHSENISQRNLLHPRSLVFFWPCKGCGGCLVATMEALEQETQFIERDGEYVIRGRYIFETFKCNDCCLTHERGTDTIGMAGCLKTAEDFLSRVKSYS